MRKLSFLLFLSVLLALFTGCAGQSPDGGSEPPGNVSPTITSLPEERREKNEDGKPILYIGAFSFGNYDIEEAYYRLESAIRNFNVKNKEFDAQIIDYGDASAPEAFYRLNTDIIAGQMPDLLLTHGMPVERYAALGLLYDMSDWLNPSEFFTGPLESMRMDGKLYEVSPGITVTSFYGLTSNLGDSGELTLDELYSIWEKFNAGGDKEFIAGFTNELICLLLISSTQSQFIDETAAACGFDSPEFIQLLEFCKKLPDKAKELNLEPDNPDFQGSPLLSYVKQPEVHYTLHVKEGEALLAMTSSSRVWGTPYAPHALMTSILDGEEVTFIGIPGAGTASVYMEFPVAVSAHSKNLKGAQEFIDQLWSLNFMCRGPGDLVMLPLKRSVLDNYVRNDLKRFGIDDVDRLIFIDDVLKPYTPVELEEFIEFVDQARLPAHSACVLYTTV
jgi:ABC-type glycerol-3-phosphate transport system substrate-binding protein